MLGKIHKVKDRNFLPELIKGIFLKAIYVLGINELEQSNNNPLAAMKIWLCPGG